VHRWDPEEYKNSSSAQQKWAGELISKIGIRGNERVLDIGSGDGKITAELARLVSKGFVLGIDNSEEMVRFAQSKFPESSHPNLLFQVGDACNLQFEEEFDIVVSFAALHWVLDHGPVLAGIRRSLKPGGKAFIQFGGKGNAAEALGIADEMITEDRWKRYFEGFSFRYGFFGPEEYRAWLDQAGLAAKRVELIPKDMQVLGKEGLASWIKSTWLPYSMRVPENLRQDFIDEIAERYVQSHPPDGDGTVHVQMVRLEAVAEKPEIKETEETEKNEK